MKVVTCDSCGRTVGPFGATFDGLDLCGTCVGELRDMLRRGKRNKVFALDGAMDAFFKNGGEEVVQTVMEACGARIV